MLATVCESLGWDYGALWEVDRAGRALRCVGTWHESTLRFDAFADISLRTTFDRGIGLPGRVWASGEPAWIPDVTQDGNFPRAPAPHAGLHGAFGLPDPAGATSSESWSSSAATSGSPTGAAGRRWQRPGVRSVCTVERKRRRRGAGALLQPFARPAVRGDLEGLRFVRVTPHGSVAGLQGKRAARVTFMDFVHPDDRPATLEAVRMLESGARVVDFENRYRARDGSYRWLQWSVAPLLQQGGSGRRGARCHRVAASGRARSPKTHASASSR